ncbi:MAG: hypothetical protein ACMXYF_03860 [Candidatus Woesearchaeota archaeon]
MNGFKRADAYRLPRTYLLLFLSLTTLVFPAFANVAEYSNNQNIPLTNELTLIEDQWPDYVRTNRVTLFGVVDTDDLFAQVYVNGQAHSTYTPSDLQLRLRDIPLADGDGEYEIYIELISSDQQSMSTVRHMIIVDTQPPQLTVRSPPRFIGGTHPTNFTISVDKQVEYEYVVENAQTASAQNSADGTWQPGNHTITPGFVEGNNTLSLTVTDQAGNSAHYETWVFVTGRPPQIASTNIETNRVVSTPRFTVRGQVEPAQEGIIVEAYTNNRYFDVSYRCSDNTQHSAETIWEFLDDPECANVRDEIRRRDQNKQTTTTNEQGEFSIPITLQRQQLSFLMRPDLTSQRDESEAEARLEQMGRNEVTLFAVDAANQRSDEYTRTISYDQCQTAGDFHIYPDDVFPAIIQPEHLFNGVAQIMFTLNVEYLGRESIDNIAITGTSIGLQSTSYIDMSDFTISDFINENSCTVFPTSGYEWSEQTTVICTLNRLSESRFGNLTETYRQLEKLQGVSLPLDVEIHYQKRVDQSRSGQQGVRQEGSYTWESQPTQRQCLDIDVYFDRRVPPDFYPNSLLNATVNLLDQGVDLIDQVIEPISQASLITFGACMATTLGGVVSYTRQASQCGTLMAQPMTMNAIRQYVSGCQDAGCAANICRSEKALLRNPFIKQACADSTSLYGTLSGNPVACAQATFQTQQSDVYRNYLCDRIFCPAVPSAQEYIRTSSRDFSSRYSSACSRDSDNPWFDTTSVGGWEAAGFSDGCQVEYDREWDSACLIHDPVEQSIEAQNPDSQREGFGAFFDTITSGFCSDRDTSRGDDYISRGGNDYYRTPITDDVDCYQLGQITATGDYADPQKRIIDPASKQLSADPVSITREGRFGLSNKVSRSGCVETLPTGELIFSPESRDGVPVRFDAQNSEIRSVSGVDPIMGQKIENQRALTTFTPNSEHEEVWARDSEGFYYRENNGVFERMQPNELSRVCRQNVPGTDTVQSYGVFHSGDGSEALDCQLIRDAPDQLAQHQVQEILIDPTDNLATALLCVCLPAIHGYLLVIRNLFEGVSSCFKSVLLTGEFQSGPCRAFLTQYLCDLIIDAIKCIGRAAAKSQQGGQVGSRGSDSIMSSVVNLRQGTQGMAESFAGRYGDTATYTALISSRKFLHSICLAAFGYDWLPDLEESLTIRGGGMQINSTATIFPADRRFMGPDPQSSDAIFMYHLGFFVIAGSDLNWRLELVCTTGYDCDPNEGFEGGICDCAHTGQEQTLTLDSGTLRGGETFGFGDPRADRYERVVRDVRFDRARLTMTPQGSSRAPQVSERYIRSIGLDEIPPQCSWSTVNLRFQCTFGSLNQFGDVFFQQGRSFELASGAAESVRVGDRLQFAIFAEQNFEGVPAQNQLPKFARVRITHDNTILHDSFTPRGLLGQIPAIWPDGPRTYTLGVGQQADSSVGEYGLSEVQGVPGSQNLQLAGFASGEPNQNVRLNIRGYLGIGIKNDTHAFLYTSRGAPRSDGSRDFGVENILTHCNEDLDQCTEVQIRHVSGEQTAADSWFIPVPRTSGQQTQGNQNNLLITREPEADQQSVLLFDRLFSASGICPPGRETDQITVTVSLHDSRYDRSQMQDQNRQVTIQDAQPSPAVYIYQGEEQKYSKTYTVFCDLPPVDLQTGEEQTVTAQQNQVVSGALLPLYICGESVMRSVADVGARYVCLNEQETKQLCRTGPVATDCVCGQVSPKDDGVDILGTDYKKCSPGQTCQPNADEKCLNPQN